MTDYRNSIIGYWDETNNLMVELADYTPEGRLTLYDGQENIVCDERGSGTTVCPTAAGLPFGLNGQWRSETTGFVYMRNRWYSPRLAQFITHDPLEYIDSYNPFTFASLDPINYWDPWGLSASRQNLAGGESWLPKPLSNDPADMLAHNGENPCAVAPHLCVSGNIPQTVELQTSDRDPSRVALGAAKAALAEGLLMHCMAMTAGVGGEVTRSPRPFFRIKSRRSKARMRCSELPPST